jgi:hypothetical protein
MVRRAGDRADGGPGARVDGLRRLRRRWATDVRAVRKVSVTSHTRFDCHLATFGENYLICRRDPRSPTAATSPATR